MIRPYNFDIWARVSLLDAYGLTKAAIEGEKSQYRVVVTYDRKRDGTVVKKKPSYEVGDEPLLLQPYCDIPELEGKGLENEQGWKNKRYVKTEYMPFRVRITGFRVERLHDITDSDSIAEGVKTYRCYGLPDVYSFENNKSLQMYTTPKAAFAVMCDKLFGITVWRRNPDVYVYEFELVPNSKRVIP